MMVTKFIGRDGQKHDFTSNYFEIGTYGIFDKGKNQPPDLTAGEFNRGE